MRTAARYPTGVASGSRRSGVRGFIAAMSVLIIASCGGGELTMDEYATEAERRLRAMNVTIDALDAEAQSRPTTLEGSRDFWDSKVAARLELVTGLEAIEPPAIASDMHDSAVGIISRLAAADQAVAELVGRMETEQELSLLFDTPEFLATENIDEEAVAICQAAQAEFDSTTDREVFRDVPWIPSELKEVISVFFGCLREDRGRAP